MSVLPSFAERKRVWVFRRCTLSLVRILQWLWHTCLKHGKLFNVVLVPNVNHHAVRCSVGSAARRIRTHQRPTYAQSSLHYYSIHNTSYVCCDITAILERKYNGVHTPLPKYPSGDWQLLTRSMQIQTETKRT